MLVQKQPDYSFLRVFGCACWPNLRPYNKRKLEFRSQQCAFLGYINLHKGFKCLEILSGRVYIFRDVVFDEAEFPFSKLHSNSNAGARLRAEISLLPVHLLNPQLEYVGDHVANSPENSDDFCEDFGANREGYMDSSGSVQERTDSHADTRDIPGASGSGSENLAAPATSPPRQSAPATSRGILLACRLQPRSLQPLDATGDSLMQRT